MLRPWEAHGINMWQLSTKSQHKQQGDHLFSWSRGTVTDHSEHSQSSGRGSRKRCPPSPWSVVSGLLRMNLHFFFCPGICSHSIKYDSELRVSYMCHTCVRLKYFWKYNSTVRYFVVREAFLVGILREEMLWWMNAIVDGKTTESLKCLLLIISSYHYYFSNSSAYVAKHYTVSECIPRSCRLRMAGFNSFSLQGCELSLYRNSTSTVKSDCFPGLVSCITML